jgi:hypothetical protein
MRDVIDDEVARCVDSGVCTVVQCVPFTGNAMQRDL